MSTTVTQQNGVHVVRIVNTEITPLAVDQLFYLLAPVERKVVCIEDSAVISNPPEVTAALNNHTDDTVRIVTKKNLPGLASPPFSLVTTAVASFRSHKIPLPKT